MIYRGLIGISIANEGEAFIITVKIVEKLKIVFEPEDYVQLLRIMEFVNS